MPRTTILKATLTTVIATTAFVALLRNDLAAAPDDPVTAAIARQELRVEAAHASVDARPLLGASGLPPYDARAAIAREEAELRRLSSMQTARR